MNKDLIEINKNCCAVSDENGNIRLIEKESNEYDFQDILLKENQIESLTSKMNKCKSSLSLIKQNKVGGNVGDVALILAAIVTFVFLNSTFSLPESIFLTGLEYIPFKGLVTLMFGTRFKRNKQEKILTDTIKRLEIDIPTLEKELEKIKEESKYNDKTSTIILPKSNNYVEETRTDSENYDNANVLSLTKKTIRF